MITTSPLPLSQLLSPLSQYHRFRNITTITTSPLSQYRSGLKVELLCYGWQWMWNGCQISTVKRSHGQEISQPKKISQPRDLTAKRSHSQNISQPRDPKRSHSQERSLARSFVFVSYTFRFWGKSRTKASLSHLTLSDFWGTSRTKASFLHLQLSLFILRESLAQKLRFRIFHFQILREVSHEMRLREIQMHEMLRFARQNVSRKMAAEACPADGCRTRLRNTFV